MGNFKRTLEHKFHFGKTIIKMKLTVQQIENIAFKGVNPRKVYQLRLFWHRQLREIKLKSNMNQLDFFNSTATDNLTRFKEKVKATSQANAILMLMQDGRKRTSVMVADELQINLNSARRALTQLDKNWGLVNKLAEMKLEKFGSNNHYYQIK